LALLDHGKTLEAHRMARMAVEAAPESEVSWMALARAQDALGDPEAKTSYEKSISIKAHPYTLNNFGAWMADQGKWDQAEKFFNQALQRDPYFAPARRNLKRLDSARNRTKN
jgi:Tfp pilus assembly protein PilF